MKDQKARFARRYRVSKETGCWLWFGHTDEDGYGRVRDGKRKVYVHRAVYRIYKGEIPDGLQIDHLCRARNCVNPDHLEPVTNKENQMRGDTLSSRNAAKIECVNGHPLSGDNLLKSKDGYRRCKVCANARCLRWYYRNREKQLEKMRV